MTADTVLLVAWTVGTLAAVRPALRYHSRLVGRNPILMCAGCQARRRSYMNSALDGGVFVFLEILGWPWHPLVPWMRRVAGTEPQPHCVGSSCAAHAHYNTHAREESP